MTIKRLNIHMREGDVARKLSLTIKELQEMDVEVCVHTCGGGLAACTWKDVGTEEILESADRELGLESAPEDLYLTDIPEVASFLAAAGRPVIAYIHERNRGTSFPGVSYVLEGTDVVAEYFIRVWQRFAGKPWHILDTERCMVRETVEEDLDAFYEIYAQPSVTAYMEGLHPDREQERQLLKAYRAQMYSFYEFGMWTVVLKETGEVIGRAGLDMPMENFRESDWVSAPALGYVIGVPWQGSGLAEEVCRGILDYAWRELGFDRVRALVHPENVRSIRLLEKLGFECVGVQEKRTAAQRRNPALQRETLAAQGETVVYGMLL